MPGGLSTGPANVQTGKIRDREGSHRKAESLESSIDLMRVGAILHCKLGLLAIGGENPVADKTFTDAAYHRYFSESSAKRQCAGGRIGRAPGALDDFDKTHDVGGREEM